MQTILSSICCSEIYNDDLRRKECQIGYLKVFGTKFDLGFIRTHTAPSAEVKEKAELYLYSPLGLCVLLEGDLYLCVLLEGDLYIYLFVFNVLYKNSVRTSQRTHKIPIQRHGVTCQMPRILKLYHVHHTQKFLKEALKPTLLSPTFVTTQPF
jgi:hypothetical protein